MLDSFWPYIGGAMQQCQSIFGLRYLGFWGVDLRGTDILNRKYGRTMSSKKSRPGWRWWPQMSLQIWSKLP